MPLEINPDLKLIDFIRTRSGSDLSSCMQCGSCSAVCDLSPEVEPYPRKEMIWAAWGLKEKLMSDPDIWLCHQCGDCSATCPRDVNPGDVLAAIRQATWENFSRPKFLAKWLSSPKYLPLLLAIPTLIIAGIIALAGTFAIPDGLINYSEFFPHAWLNGSFSIFVLATFTMNWLSIRKFSKRLHYPAGREKTGYLKSVLEIVLHSRFRKCKTNRNRSLAHILVFGGFVLLLVVTLFAILAVILDKYPLTFWHPVKIIGNLAGVAMLFGLVMMGINRFRNNEGGSRGNYSDWFFLVSLFLLALSGILVEAARFAEWGSAYHLYFFHLIMVWQIVLYLPYSKFSHVIFRAISLSKT
ncbi:MAG: quinone-interacting membrane-bound oxidoreductase complex subunit QmoC [Bacteroidetes bacterium]|mgnify:FL=1|jgi:quinone-modifying oxidoreductase, subunit QmoC|nr:quinone-interacting membrane-bound oxidoreductase complex subunit QmoC [Bacteroidota bacterium]MBT4401673.1 quinone-interacting membrane-bound oxidoreductase complex subunit QmoC [Bacteroidota bacterium]MBT4408850.1 quinone-interacting membrane-bound oxidoreductase complex subunit QmoC [Bacteroidota bacterium]MBT5425028.1 quinone-interacting membrane-bound oxidoreductase complex subunit QmoC [Bacteroidota bacterium]MBT7092463.1 quinone-interacting membrane-bound oxidoreductase complex subuni